MEFSRPVVPRCLECHASSFDGSKQIAIADRAMCSAFRANVVMVRVKARGAKRTGKAQAGGAGNCESGEADTGTPARVVFVMSWRIAAGASCSLSRLVRTGDFLKLETPKENEPLDPHGNQVALLERSKCFKQSTMTCSTCHDVHVRQREVANSRNAVWRVTRLRAAVSFQSADDPSRASASIAIYQIKLQT